MKMLPLLALLTLGAADPPAWTEPTAPFPIIGPIHYVGSRGLAAYLITTRDGAILIDGTLAQNVPAIERNIAAVGVPIRRVKILLNSHAHFDHAEGLARLKRDSGARLEIMDADANAIEMGVPPSIVSYGVVRFPPAHVDRVLHDGDTVSLGGVTLTALKTPGHTPGCTTWTMSVNEGPVRDGARTLRAVFPCSLTVAGNRLVGNTGYPGIVADFRRTFARMATLKADVVLPAHPELADVMQRRARAAAGARDAFVDPALLGRIVAGSKAAFEHDLARQQASFAPR